MPTMILFPKSRICHLWKRLIDNFVHSSGETAVWAEFFIILAIDDNSLKNNKLSIEEKGQAYYQYLEDNRTKLLCENLIPLLMIGTEDEKVKALEVLQRETGQEFTGYYNWFKWMYESQLKIYLAKHRGCIIADPRNSPVD